MDQHGTTTFRHADVAADLVYLAPMSERPHSYTYDPPAAVPQREGIEPRTNAFHLA